MIDGTEPYAVVVKKIYDQMPDLIQRLKNLSEIAAADRREYVKKKAEIQKADKSRVNEIKNNLS